MKKELEKLTKTNKKYKNRNLYNKKNRNKQSYFKK